MVLYESIDPTLLIAAATLHVWLAIPISRLQPNKGLATTRNHLADNSPSLVWLGHWILFSAACNASGWLLSAIHQLNTAGFLLTIPFIWFFLTRLSGITHPRFSPASLFKSWKYRSRKLLPIGL